MYNNLCTKKCRQTARKYNQPVVAKYEFQSLAYNLITSLDAFSNLEKYFKNLKKILIFHSKNH